MPKDKKQIPASKVIKNSFFEDEKKHKEKINNQFKQVEEQIVDKSNEEKPDQTDSKKARATFVMKEFRLMQDNRDQGFKHFGFGEDKKALNLLKYIDESELRINSSIAKPAWKADWQANVFDPITREKFNSYLAKLAANRMKAKFLDDEGLDSNLATVVTNLYERAGRGKNGQGKDVVLIFKGMFEAGSKGTVIKEETYKDGMRRIKDRDEWENNQRVVYNTIYEWEDVWSEIVPLQEFYPGDIKKMNVQEAGKCARCQYADYETFIQALSDLDDIQLVKPIQDLSNDQQTAFGIDNKESQGSVQVVKYYNRITDSFDVVANGILLTPIGQPLQHGHGQIPFNVGRFDIFSNEFFYGMSLAHKLSTFQDITNSLWNMMLDELFIALKTPIFNATGVDIDVNWMYPGSVIDLGKKADINGIKELQINSNASIATGAIGTIKQRLDGISASGSEQSGIAGEGRQKTAEEVATAREASTEITGLFLSFMEWAEEDRAEQRCQNMLWYYSKKLKGSGEYRRFVIEDVRLISGEMGKMIINITDKPRSKDELDDENMTTDDLSQNIDITPDMLRNFKKLVKIIPDSSSKDTKERQKRDELQFYELTKENPAINQQENVIALVEAFGKDVNKLINKQQPTAEDPAMAEIMANAPAPGGQAK